MARIRRQRLFVSCNFVAPTPPKGKSLRKRLRQSRTPWLYILPAGLLMAVITLMPQLFQMWMSLTDFTIENLRFNFLLSESYEYAPEYATYEGEQMCRLLAILCAS